MCSIANNNKHYYDYVRALYMGLTLLGSLRAWPFECRVSASQLSSTARLSAKPAGGAFGIKFHDAKWMIICDYTASRQWEPQQILEAKDTTTSTHGCLCGRYRECVCVCVLVCVCVI